MMVRNPLLRSSRRSWYAFALIGAAVFGAASCSNSRLVEVWQDPTFNGPPLEHVMVVAMWKRDVTRRLWEDAFVAEAKRPGLTIVPSYQFFPNELPKVDEIKDRVAGEHLDGVIVIRRLSPETVRRHVPGYVTSVPRGRYGRGWGRYGTFYQEVYHPGYTETNRVVQSEVTVWDARGDDGQMIWSGTGQSINPTSTEDVRKDLTHDVLPKLVKGKVLE